jgi:hypothetical protein
MFLERAPAERSGLLFVSMADVRRAGRRHLDCGARYYNSRENGMAVFRNNDFPALQYR